MILILKVVTSVAIFLGIVIALVAAHSYRSRVGPASSIKRTLTMPGGAGERVRETLNLINSFGVRQGVIRGYGQMRAVLMSKQSFEQRGQWTERETIEALKTTPGLKPIEEELRRIYKTYERARFGSDHLPNKEIDFFIDDLRAVYGNILREKEVA